MNTIKVYPRNSDERVKLTEAARELTRISGNGTVYTVEETYFDYGQNWMWTTIIAHRQSGDSFQRLCPRDHEKIIMSKDIPATVAEITADKYWKEL